VEDEEFSNVVMELEQALGGREKILARQQSQISDDGGSGDTSLRKRTTSVRSQDSSSHTPSPAKRMSITPKKDDVASPEKVKDKLIEVEKAETGSVKGDVYTHYFKAVGIPMVFLTMVFSAVSQAFQIGGNAWLSKWSEEPKKEDGTIDVDRRNMFLGVYAALGFGQCKCILCKFDSYCSCNR